MTEQEEQFIHFVSCIRWLNNAWCLLNTIKKDKDNPLIVPVFRFALIEYSKAYKLSHGVTQKFNLDRSCIPSQLHALHEQIIGSRDQVHAHSDLTVMDAKLYVHEFKGQRYTTIPQKRITGGEELPNINEITDSSKPLSITCTSKKKNLKMRYPHRMSKQCTPPFVLRYRSMNGVRAEELTIHRFCAVVRYLTTNGGGLPQSIRQWVVRSPCDLLHRFPIAAHHGFLLLSAPAFDLLFGGQGFFACGAILRP